MEQDIVISEATINNINEIINIANKSWNNTYINIISTEQINYMLNMFYSYNVLEENIKQNIEKYFLANFKNINCGFLAIQKINNEVYKINKLYVLPDFTKKNIGKNLMQKAINYAKDNYAKAIILNVNRNNNNAIGYYLKNNFKIIREENNPIGNNYFMNDFVLEKAL